MCTSRVYAKPSCTLSLLVPDSFIWGQERAARFRHISKTPCPCFRIFKYTHCMCAPFIEKQIIRDPEFVWTIHLISRVQVWVLLFLLSPRPMHNFLKHCYVRFLSESYKVPAGFQRKRRKRRSQNAMLFSSPFVFALSRHICTF